MLLILFLLFVGLLLGNSSKNSHGQIGSVLATFAIYVSLPALVLKYLHSIPFSVDVVMPAIAPFLVFFIVLTVVLVFWRAGAISTQTAGCLVLVCGTGNASIVGIPIIQAYYGAETVGYSVIFDQANFVVMSLLALSAASYFSAASSSAYEISKTVLTYPPMIATILALVTRPIEYPAWMEQGLSVLAGTLTPVAIVSVGASLKLKEISVKWSVIIYGLFGKLILIPLAIFLIFSVFFTNGDSLAFKVSIIQAGMPPMIVAGMIAVEKKLDPPMAIALISLGIPLSFVTIFLMTLML